MDEKITRKKEQKMRNQFLFENGEWYFHYNDVKIHVPLPPSGKRLTAILRLSEAKKIYHNYDGLEIYRTWKANEAIIIYDKRLGYTTTAEANRLVKNIDLFDLEESDK